MPIESLEWIVVHVILSNKARRDLKMNGVILVYQPEIVYKMSTGVHLEHAIFSGIMRFFVPITICALT